MTRAPSITIPKWMAPRLIRFAEIPNAAMPKKPNSSEIGMTKATISAARITKKGQQHCDYQQPCLDDDGHAVDRLA